MPRSEADQKRFEEAVKLHRKGVDGNKSAVIEAHRHFAGLRTRYPGDALLEAYFGSSLALLGRDAVHPLEKADKAQQGLDALDRAVALDPDGIEIRMIRGKVCVRLPEDFFRRSATAIEDFTLLLDRNEANPGLLTAKQADDIRHDLAAAEERRIRA